MWTPMCPESEGSRLNAMEACTCDGQPVAAGAGLSRRQNRDCPSYIRQGAARPASTKFSALRIWSAFALLMTLVTVPLFSTMLPPLFDYPNHLARLYLLRRAAMRSMPCGGNCCQTSRKI